MLTKKEKYNIAVVGATGIVGESLLSILHSRKFPISSIIAVASDKSKGTKVKFGEKLLTVESINGFNFNQIDIAFFRQASPTGAHLLNSKHRALAAGFRESRPPLLD